MAQRPMRFLLLVAAFGLVLPGCAQWGSWFSASKPASPPPSNAVQPANQGHQFGAKKPSAIESFFGKGKPSEPPAPPARPRTPEEIKASQMAMARLCERRGEQDQAEAIYQGLVAKYPQDPTPHHRLGVLAVQKGKFAEAEAHFRTAERLAPPSADLLSDLGYMYYLQHRLPESEATLRQALVRDPQHMAATNNLALTVGAQGRFDEALTLFR
ncbi:MAG: tetratricopeptide repeat protein, partial [Thermoguttaceae bacterium]|nr:tetratricopeptide repeat protein [Thermoguttaceae bacterium]